MEALKTLLQHAMQNGASLLDAADIITSDNISEIKYKLADVEEARAKREEEMNRIQQETEMAKQEVLMQIESERNRLTEEDSIRKSETSIQVALINAESKIATSNQGVEDDSSIDEEKIKLQAEKQRRDSDLKSRQIEEDVRKNRVAEKQKQQEIEIKRKQANTPNKSS